MSTNDPDTRETLQTDFENQAEWRWEKAVEQPDDLRNVEAAETLEKLAESVGDVPAETIDTYKELWENNDAGFNRSELHSEMMREIGFSYAPSSAEEFVKDFINKATSA